MLQRLIEYKTVHGDCKVPQHYNKDPQLGRWVNNQRSAYKRNDMLEERKCILNSIGFVLNAMNAKPSGTKRVTWKEMYRRLVAYKTVHHKDANDDVPQSYYDVVDPQLGDWVFTQRCRVNKMTEERKQLLNYIGFVWEGIDKIRR